MNVNYVEIATKTEVAWLICEYMFLSNEMNWNVVYLSETHDFNIDIIK